MLDLTGQTAVIVGGTGDIGGATARLFAEVGTSVVVTGRTSASVSRRVGLLGDGVRGEIADPHDETSLNAFFARVGSFEHLVVTLGTQATTTTFAALDEGELMRGIEDKLLTYTRTLHAALPHVRQSVTWLTAASARSALAGMSGYAAPNGALHAMLGPIAVELAPLRINCVSPGLTRTRFWDALGMSQDEQEAMFTRASRTILLQRIGTAEEIAHAILFAASNLYVTGTVLDISGGLQLGPVPSAPDPVSYGNH